MKITRRQIKKLLKESVESEKLLKLAKKAVGRYNYPSAEGDDNTQLEINDAVRYIVDYLVATSKVNNKKGDT